MKELNKKMDDSWFEPDCLVLLYGNFTSGTTKTEIKKLLDDLNIKWTIKKDTSGITKIVSMVDRYYLKSKNSWCPEHFKDLKKACSHIASESQFHPDDIPAMVGNMNNDSKSEYSEQILSLLKSSDVSNINLAVTLIDNSDVEEEWRPWLLINKGVLAVSQFLRKRRIDQGQWNLWKLEENVGSLLYELQSKLRINKKQAINFLKDYVDRS